jgi:hypothetical protein
MVAPLTFLIASSSFSPHGCGNHCHLLPPACRYRLSKSSARSRASRAAALQRGRGAGHWLYCSQLAASSAVVALFVGRPVTTFGKHEGPLGATGSRIRPVLLRGPSIRSSSYVASISSPPVELLHAGQARPRRQSNSFPSLPATGPPHLHSSLPCHASQRRRRLT